MAHSAGPKDEVRAKLFLNGRSQAVRLPKEFRFEGKEVRVRHAFGGVLLEPVEEEKKEAWKTLKNCTLGSHQRNLIRFFLRGASNRKCRIGTGARSNSRP